MRIECNICGGTNLVAGGLRGLMVCQDCSAHPVTRILWLLLTESGLLRPGVRILHIAPERAFADRLRAVAGENYDPVDIDPAGYAHVPGTRPFDLCADAAELPSAFYDLVIHSHVMEHVKCNVTAVLWHLHRALRPGGLHLCCIPFTRDRYSSEDLAPLSQEDAIARFGQNDHVRIFGARDVQDTVGRLFRLPGDYDLLRRFPAELLDRYAIPDVARAGWTPHSVLALAKDDLLLA
ncbi:methyltransferase domain-containing protein [Sphingomonas crusticola]|uniref:methyltransferase domain-containing protein n=1 Tax=Sphingomonas crusticola TaxID=1697973 RepID=UPI0013C2D3DA|nr:methyltransferase domain-containing protein [Sphingomonas crusticola]